MRRVPRYPIHIETRARRPGCSECGALARVKDRPVVTPVDLAAFGRPTRLVWHKFRWLCAEETCAGGSWTEDEPRIAAKRLMLSDRAGRWVTEQVGRHARTVNEIAVELGCDWHTINDTVVAYGSAMVEHKDRFGKVEAFGLDEVLFARVGQWHRQEFSTQIVDVNAAVRELYTHTDAHVALEWLERLCDDMLDTDSPIEVRSLGRTLKRWSHQIVAWHTAHVTNGPTEAVNNLIKRVKRAAFGFTSFRNYRIRSPLYAGKPDWPLLATIKPR